MSVRTDETAQMTALYDQLAADGQAPSVWDVCWTTAVWGSRPIYARWRGETRGFAAGSGKRVRVPVVVWMSLLVARPDERGILIVFGRAR